MSEFVEVKQAFERYLAEKLIDKEFPKFVESKNFADILVIQLKFMFYEENPQYRDVNVNLAVSVKPIPPDKFKISSFHILSDKKFNQLHEVNYYRNNVMNNSHNDRELVLIELKNAKTTEKLDEKLKLIEKKQAIYRKNFNAEVNDWADQRLGLIFEKCKDISPVEYMERMRTGIIKDLKSEEMLAIWDKYNDFQKENIMKTWESRQTMLQFTGDMSRWDEHTNEERKKRMEAYFNFMSNRYSSDDPIAQFDARKNLTTPKKGCGCGGTSPDLGTPKNLHKERYANLKRNKKVRKIY